MYGFIGFTSQFNTPSSGMEWQSPLRKRHLLLVRVDQHDAAVTGTISQTTTYYSRYFPSMQDFPNTLALDHPGCPGSVVNGTPLGECQHKEQEKEPFTCSEALVKDDKLSEEGFHAV